MGKRSSTGWIIAGGAAILAAVVAFGTKKAKAAPVGPNPHEDGLTIAVTDVPNTTGPVEVLLRGGTAYVGTDGPQLPPEVKARVIQLALAAAGVPAPQISWASTLPGEQQ